MRLAQFQYGESHIHFWVLMARLWLHAAIIHEYITEKFSLIATHFFRSAVSTVAGIKHTQDTGKARR